MTPDTLSAAVTYSAITSIHEGSGSLEIIGSAAIGDGCQPRVAAVCAAETYKWMIPSYNMLGAGLAVYDAVAAGVGNEKRVQVLVLRNAAFVLVAWQRGILDWVSMPNGGRLLSATGFTSISLERGKKHLNVIGLCKDGTIRRGAYQDDGGSWHPGTDGIKDGIVGHQAHQYTACKLIVGADRNLQIVGLTTEGTLYLAGWFNYESSHHNFANIDIGSAHGEKIVDFVADVSEDKRLIIICLTHLGRVYATATQNEKGLWVRELTRLDTVPDKLSYRKIIVGPGNLGTLQVVGIAQDGTVRLISYRSRKQWISNGFQLGTGAEHIVFGRMPDALRLFSLDRLGNLSLLNWLDNGGSWHDAKALSLEHDSGRSEAIRLRDVEAAFQNVKNEYSRRLYSGTNIINPFDPKAHYQGFARYGNWDILTHDRKWFNNVGYIQAFDRKAGKLIHDFDTPVQNFPHPGGCQIVGDYLAIELEAKEGDEGYLVFYWLGGMTQRTRPVLLPARFWLDPIYKGPKAVGITTWVYRGAQNYLVVINGGGGFTFFTTGQYLDDPRLTFQFVFVAPPADDEHGYDNICLFTQQDGRIFLLAMGGKELSTAPDWGDLYAVDPAEKTLTLVARRFFDIVSWKNWFVGFRYPAGATPTSSDDLELYTANRHPPLGIEPDIGICSYDKKIRP